MKVYAEMSECFEHFAAAESIAVDIETTGLDPWNNETAVISVASPTGEVVVEHVIHQGISDAMRDILAQDKEWITHNGANFDVLFLGNAGIPVPAKHYDTLIGEQVLETQARHDRKKDLGSAMQRRLGENYKQEIDHDTWQLPTLTPDQLSYAAHDVLHLHRLQKAQKKVAVDRKLDYALSREEDLSSLVAQITMNGWAFSSEKYEELKQKLYEEAERGIGRVRFMAGRHFNPRSSQQVADFLERKFGITLPRTQKGNPKADKESLTELMEFYPIVGDILNWRAYSRRVDFYAENWQDQFVQEGRVHPRFWQCGAETTRFTCSDPNMQQIPRNMREMIGNEPGKMVISADYSQIETRILAFYSQDMNLIEVLDNDDIHSENARIIFRTATPTSEQRSIAKAVTFAWAFGGGPGSVQKTSTRQGNRALEFYEAKELLRNLNARFPVAQRYIRRTGSSAGKATTVHMPLGHRRSILQWQSTPQRLINTKIQGSAAIGLKLAIFRMAEAGLLPYISGVVHDEVVATSVPENEAKDFAVALSEAMVQGMVDLQEDWNERSQMDYKVLSTPVEPTVSFAWQK